MRHNRILVVLVVFSLVLVVLCVSDMDAHIKGIIFISSLTLTILYGSKIMDGMNDKEEKFMNIINELFVESIKK